LGDVKRSGSPPSAGTTQTSVCLRFFSSCTVVTVKATRRPSGESAGEPTVTTRYQSAGVNARLAFFCATASVLPAAAGRARCPATGAVVAAVQVASTRAAATNVRRMADTPEGLMALWVGGARIGREAGRGKGRAGARSEGAPKRRPGGGARAHSGNTRMRRPTEAQPMRSRACWGTRDAAVLGA